MALTPFKPGKSGNPGGRPKVADLRRLARERTVDAITTLIQVMRSPKSAAAARVMAANSLLDRGWGKAVQPTAFTDMDGEDRPLPVERSQFESARRIAHMLAEGLRALPEQQQTPVAAQLPAQPQLNGADTERDRDE